LLSSVLTVALVVVGVRLGLAAPGRLTNLFGERAHQTA
jgi:hypothetical protein